MSARIDHRLIDQALWSHSRVSDMAETFQRHMKKIRSLNIEACHGEMSLTKIRRRDSLRSASDKWCSLKGQSIKIAFSKRG